MPARGGEGGKWHFYNDKYILKEQMLWMWNIHEFKATRKSKSWIEKLYGPFVWGVNQQGFLSINPELVSKAQLQVTDVCLYDFPFSLSVQASKMFHS